MRLHVARRAGIERVFLVEHLLRRRLLDKLEHAARFAIGGRELEEIFVRNLIGRQKPVRNGHSPETHESFNRANYKCGTQS